MTQVEEPVLSAGDRASTGHLDVEQVQRRTVQTLLGSQMCGGIGLVAGYSVTALLADDITGSKTLAALPRRRYPLAQRLHHFLWQELWREAADVPGC